MANPNQQKFNDPSRLFIWAFSLENFFFSRSYYNKLVSEINFYGNESVLDFGSGVGSLSKKIIPKLQPDGHLTCVDVSEKLLRHTSKKLQKYQNVKYYHGNLIDMDIPDDSLDIIVSTWVIHHVDKAILPQTIKKFKDILKKDGRIYIIEFGDNKIDHTNLSQKQLLDLFAQENFDASIIFTKKQGILYKFQNKV